MTEADSKPDSLEEASATAESVILVKSVKTTRGENNTTTMELADLEHVEIIYTNSCASADGTQVRKDTDVTFRNSNPRQKSDEEFSAN